MSDDKLTPEQNARAIGLREANYYFGFTAQIRKPAEGDPTEPAVRVGVILGIAEHFANYILSGDVPNGGSE